MKSKYCLLFIVCAMQATTQDTPISLIAQQMKVALQSFPLPISMSDLLKRSPDKNQVSKIEIKMGHLTSNNQHQIFPRGITMYITNQTELQSDYLTRLKSLFQVSQDNRFEFYLQQEQILIISDPNDRFCTEHLEYYLKQFFPCKNFASLGLEKLLNPSKLLQKYLTFEFKWIAKLQQIHFKIVFPKEKEIINFQKETVCGNLSVYSFSSNQDHPQTKIKTKSLKYSGLMLNKWYNPQKCISHMFKFKELREGSRFKVISMLPLGFIFDNFTVHPKDTRLTYTESQIESSVFHIFRVEPSPGQDQTIRIHLYFHSAVPSFQNFQTIAGGGEQIMNVPLFIEEGRVFHLHSDLISQRLLQPDFSIPFQTITFTVGIIGYLWINLWRIYRLKIIKKKAE